MTPGAAPGQVEGPVPGTRRGSGLTFALSLVPFLVLATLNSGGYRYGASDQAFYQPAVLKQLDPALFPRDSIVLAAQTRLTAADEVMAAIVRFTGASVPVTFAALYVIALALFAWAVWRIGTRLYANRWTAVALLAAVTLRHAIARSGTNTLEGYFQPRLLAYAAGALAIAAFLDRRWTIAGLLVAGAATVHPTTAVWFGLWLGVAATVADPAARKWGLAAGVAALAGAGWAVLAGPLAGRLVPLDPEWRRILEAKDYLFPLEWPAYAWLVNVGYLPLIAWCHHLRRRAGLVTPLERALVGGSAVLAGVFVAALACQAFGIALAFQLQPARIFWMFDFLAVVHVVWWIAEGAGVRRARPAQVAAVIAALSLARGAYVIHEHRRPPVQLSLPDDDWGRVMAWARTTDKRDAWLAHPMHAHLYGTSVRVAGERDVLVEAVKDTALGMYDRAVAARTDERMRAVPSFEELTVEAARALAERYDLQFLVTEAALDLPEMFRSGALHVYRLR